MMVKNKKNIYTEKEKELIIMLAIKRIIIQEPDTEFAKLLKQLFG